jgi:hypothetical protein
MAAAALMAAVLRAEAAVALGATGRVRRRVATDDRDQGAPHDDVAS